MKSQCASWNEDFRQAANNFSVHLKYDNGHTSICPKKCSQVLHGTQAFRVKKKNSLFIWNSNGAGCFVFYLAALAGRLTRRNKEATKASIYPSWKERNFHACPWSALRVDVRLFAVWEACCSATGSSHPHPQVHLGHPGQPGSQSSHKTKQILLF